VTVGFKIADIDPRQEELSNCFTISDKARCIAGSVLELVAGYVNKKRGNTL
jgi:xanthine dehydrogenase accessory factor